jgi:hypothetical protein
MNAILLGAASVGALLAIFTHDPGNVSAAQAVADDAEVARLMEAAPDAGWLQPTMLVNPITGDTAKVSVIAFRE